MSEASSSTPALAASCPPPASSTVFNSRQVLMTNSAGTFSGSLLTPKRPDSEGGDKPFKASDPTPLPLATGFTPFVILVAGFPDLPEPSMLPLAEFLIRRERCCVLIPHMRGDEYTSLQEPKRKTLGKKIWNARTGYHVADLASDLLDWIAEMQARKFISRSQGVVLVGHDWGSVICQSAAATYHFRRHALGAAGTDNVDSADKYRPVIRGLVLLSVPPLQNFWWYCLMYPIQQLLLCSWYWFFFQIPLLPEYVLTHTNLMEWLWKRWSPGMDADVRAHRAKGVLRHYIIGGTPRSERFPAAAAQATASAASQPEEDPTEDVPSAKKKLPESERRKQLALATPYASSSIARTTGTQNGQVLTAKLQYYRCLFNPFSMVSMFSYDMMFGSKLWALDARTTPTLAMVGLDDGCIRADVFEACCTSVTRGDNNFMLEGGVHCVKVPKAGHWVHLEQPSVVHSHIAQFLADLTGSNEAASVRAQQMEASAAAAGKDKEANQGNEDEARVM